jgi:hypothetical protein
MKAIERRFELVVIIETITLEGDSFEDCVAEIRKRIASQISGHRTEKRLADYCKVSSIKILSELSREV